MQREPQLRQLRYLTLVIFFAVLLLNLLLLTKNYYWDGIFFAQTIEDAPRLNASLIHPNHLLDQVMQFMIYRGIRLLGFHPRMLTVLQLSSCVFSAAAAGVFFRIALRSFTSVYVSVVLTALLAFSATWWRFSTDADTYVLAVLLLLVCFYLVLPDHDPRPFTLAIVHALALLAHQLSVFFFPVATVGIVLQSKSSGSKNAIKYVALVAALTLGAYCLAFYLVTGTFSLARFVAWTTSFSPEHGFTFNVFANLVYTLRSQGRVFFGGRLSFIREFWEAVVLSLVALAALTVLVFGIATFRHPSEVKNAVVSSLAGPHKFRPLTILCAIWIATYFTFLFFFIPQNTFYRLFYLAPVILLAGTFLTAAMSAPGHVRRYRAALFAAAMFCSNLAFSQYPYTQTRANPPLELALKLSQIWAPGTVVYFAQANSDAGLVRYFNPGTVWVQAKPENLIQDVPAMAGRSRAAWLETTMVDALAETSEGKAWLEVHAMHRTDCELVNRKYRIQFWQLKPESFASH